MAPLQTSQVQTCLEDLLDTECTDIDIKLKKKTTQDNQIFSKSKLKVVTYVRRWERTMGFVTPLRWKSILSISLFHIITLAFCANYLYNWRLPKWQTALFTWVMVIASGFGVTGGVHRYWCHRSFKATRPLQVILLLFYSTAGQNKIHEWVRDHRVHHKFSETSADPHDANRGFFFSHVGWLMMKKHPNVLEKGSKIDMSDILNDPLVMFHAKYFTVFKLVCCFILPTLTPTLLWNESWDIAALSAVIRFLYVLHCTWSVNSLAHLWGSKPYDRNIMPSENLLVSILAGGEGWHNYHHTFPWDYKVAELPYFINLSTVFIDFFALIGWAYDLKYANPMLVESVALSKGETNYRK